MMAADLHQRLALTPYSRAEFSSCKPEQFDVDDIVERARLTIVRALPGSWFEFTERAYVDGVSLQLDALE